MTKESTNHSYDRWARRRSDEYLAYFIAEHAPARARDLLIGTSDSYDSPARDRKLAAAGAELDRRRAIEAVGEAARLRELIPAPPNVDRGVREVSPHRDEAARRASQQSQKGGRT